MSGTHVDADVEDNVYLWTNELPREVVCELNAHAADGSVIYESRLIRGCAG